MDTSSENGVSYREHIAARDELARQIQEIKLQQVHQAAELLHLPAKVDKLSDNVAALTQQIASRALQPQPQVDQAVLAIQHAAQAFSALPRSNNGGGIERWLLIGLVGLAGWFVPHFLMGH